jgi:hypothetical protein
MSFRRESNSSIVAGDPKSLEETMRSATALAVIGLAGAYLGLAARVAPARAECLL